MTLKFRLANINWTARFYSKGKILYRPFIIFSDLFSFPFDLTDYKGFTVKL